MHICLFVAPYSPLLTSYFTIVWLYNTVTSIGMRAFYHCDSLTDVYYKGTRSEWENIKKEMQTFDLTKATLYYYSEAQPSETGNYWHYVDGVPTAW